MGNRYWITGVQLGMLIGVPTMEKRNELGEAIMNRQMLILGKGILAKTFPESTKEETKGCGKYFPGVNVFCGDSRRPLCSECREDTKEELDEDSVLLNWIKKNYGAKRCGEVLETCGSCVAWNLYDRLVQNKPLIQNDLQDTKSALCECGHKRELHTRHCKHEEWDEKQQTMMPCKCKRFVEQQDKKGCNKYFEDEDRSCGDKYGYHDDEIRKYIKKKSSFDIWLCEKCQEDRQHAPMCKDYCIKCKTKLKSAKEFDTCEECMKSE